MQTIANRIFLLDYWWNRAIEDQAIDRVHRFGQEREVSLPCGSFTALHDLVIYRQVFVHRFLIKQSIEGKMQKLQEKKTQVIDASLDTDNDNMTMQEQFAAIFEDDFIFSITD
jgi:DNA repair protein RAD5